MMKVDLSQLRTGLKALLPLASKEKARPHLNTVHFAKDTHDKHPWLSLVATDGHRIARVSLRARSVKGWEDVTVTRDEAERLAMNLKQHKQGDLGVLKLVDDGLEVDRYGRFTLGDAFPPYTKVIPPLVDRCETPAYVIDPVYAVQAYQVFTAVHPKGHGVRVNPVESSMSPRRFDTAPGHNHEFRVTVAVMPMRWPNQ